MTVHFFRTFAFKSIPSMRNYILTALICLFAAFTADAQTGNDELKQILLKFKAASAFDYNYPREKVYLHLDNTAYLEGDTLWYKAYVVQASTLAPTTLSKILYVELLNADGQQMELQTLTVDELGQADGCFKLNLPVRAGFYEVRAFTREMTNWGAAACYSRIIPVFAARQTEKSEVAAGSNDLTQLEIPMPLTNRKQTFGSPRPRATTGSNTRVFGAYPEGGNFIKGMQQQLAFELTDGNGYGVTDAVEFYDENSNLLASATAEHEGLGSVMLPAGATATTARVSGRKKIYALPKAVEGFALQALRNDEGVYVHIAASDSLLRVNPLLGLVVMNRDKMCYFDTLTVDASGRELQIPQRGLRAGVNRIELFDASGRSWATRLVWSFPTEADSRTLNLDVKQNKREYGAFEPAVVTMKLTAGDGQPVKSTFSLSVRDRGGFLQQETDGGIMADLLLSSEVRGYIHNPELYFAKDDAAHRRMLDLLLLVRGWTANTFEVMSGATPFNCRQPIEDKLILRGWLLADNKTLKPQANFSLDLRMYNRAGQTLEGTVTTDEKGYFAFESNVSFEGDFIAQFTMRNEDGKRKWSRLCLDRWFMPPLSPLRQADLNLRPYTSSEEIAAADEPQTFEWTDTIPRLLPTMLGEAKVTTTTRYHGFTGNRYSWGGGEKTGLSRATKYYNIQREVERRKDMGYAVGTIWDFLGTLENDTYTSDAVSMFDANTMSLAGEENNMPQVGTNQTGPTFGVDEPNSSPMSEETNSELNAVSFTGLSYSLFKSNGVPYRIYLNNKNVNEDIQRYPERFETLMADELKSAAIADGGMRVDAVKGQVTNRSKSRYSLYLYEVPDYYRYKDSKGIERRVVSGFTPQVKFYNRNYRSFDLPTDTDVRRTLLWSPSVSTNDEGEAHVVFFTNSRDVQRLDISVRGVTKNGEFIEN